jgi:hypothetical protein
VGKAVWVDALPGHTALGKGAATQAQSLHSNRLAQCETYAYTVDSQAIANQDKRCPKLYIASPGHDRPLIEQAPV